MTSFLATTSVTTPAATRRGRLSPGVSFSLQASILVFFLVGSTAPTPLYAVYEARWGFSPITVTLVFGVYAVAVLTSLLTVGSLSDYIGRRPVLLAAIALQATSMLVFADADGVAALLVARIVQGLSTGAAVGALGAGLLDLSKTRGTITNGAGPLIGTAVGVLGSSLLVQYLPAPTHLVYLALFTIFVLQGVGVALMPETSVPKAGALASLRPRFSVPAPVRRPLLAAAPAFVAVWALAGFYLSLGPTLAGLVAGSHSLVHDAFTVFVLPASAAVTVLLARNAPARPVMFGGTAALVVGVGITLLAIATTSPATFFTGAVVAGAGFGGGFQGALRTLLPLAAPHERAGLLSTIYVICYLAFGLPAVVAGVLVVHGGLLATAREYGAVVMALGLLALLGLASRRREPQACPAD